MSREVPRRPFTLSLSKGRSPVAGRPRTFRRRVARSAPIAILASALLGTALPTPAVEAPPEAADPALEARMVRITAELRCLVCQNQTIADSNADLAVDLRRQTRELLVQGRTDAQVIDYMTARYGDFVLYRPPLKTTTALLWGGPVLMLVVGAALLVLVLRRRSAMPAGAFEPDLDDDAEDVPIVERRSVAPADGRAGPVPTASERRSATSA